MEAIGEYRGYAIYWSDPDEDAGSGSGEVMVGSDSAGYADTEQEARDIAEQFIDDYEGKMDNMEPVDD